MVYVFSRSVSTDLFKDLSKVADNRHSVEKIESLDVIPSLYEGNLPPEFDKYFPKNETRHVINMTRLAHDDLATTVGRMPDLFSPPLNQSNAELKKVTVSASATPSSVRLTTFTASTLMPAFVECGWLTIPYAPGFPYIKCTRSVIAWAWATITRARS